MFQKLTHDQIQAVYNQGVDAVIQLVDALQQHIEYLEHRIEEHERRIAELEQRLAKNSHNSSKPPSTDMQRPQPKSLREKSGKKSGGQEGHEGHSLRQVDKPDYIKTISLTGLCSCGRKLNKCKVIGVEKHQVIDSPQQIKMETTEYQAQIVECACGRTHMAPFPAGAQAPVQYGPRIRAIVTYCSAYQLLPQKRITELMADIFGVSLCEGTLNKILQSAHGRLEETEKAIKNHICANPVVHGDETGMYVKGKRLWEHTLGTDLYTYYFCHGRRGKQALQDDATLHRFIGRLVHDGWMSYFDLDCLHALCNAHHLRELVFIGEQGRNQQWATTMIKLLCHIKKVVDRAKQAGRKQLAAQTLQRYRHRYEALVSRGYRANPSAVKVPGRRGRTKQSPAFNLLNRLHTHAGQTLAFMYDFNVPFDNNQSERDLRMTKVKQKISGCFRSMLGAQIFCRIRGYISTIRKHGLNVYDHLVMCFDPECIQAVLLPEGRE